MTCAYRSLKRISPLPALTLTICLSVVSFTGISFANTAQAQTPASPARPARAEVDAANTVRITYGYPAWNTSSTKIDSASILMREGVSGRIVQIHLDEEAPDSAIFSGLFSIKWENLEKLQVEFYVPPQNLLNTNDGMKKIATLIANKELRRKPFILRRSDTQLQTIELYDSVEQAQTAMKAYLQSQAAQAHTAQVGTVDGLKARSYPTNDEIDVSKLADENGEQAEAAKAALERTRLSQIEAQRVKDMLAKASKLEAKQTAENHAKAATLVASANQLIMQNKPEEALPDLEEAVQLEPENKSYLYQLGGSLYRAGDFNRAIVVLQLAAGANVNEVERQYYLALSYFGLKDYDNSEAAFSHVIASRDPVMTDSSQFYLGVIKYERREWDRSQEAFQKVLDTSRDTSLDKKAEAYIEQILRSRQFEAERVKRWQLSLTLGEMADSNVVLASTSSLDQGTATNTFGYRSLALGSLRYRPVYEPEREFAAQLDVLTMYTVDKSLAASTQLRDSDQTVFTLSLPWSFKSTAFGYGYKLDLAPGYETIIMAIENDTSKVIVDSLIMNVNNLVVMSNTWFANWNIESRRDTSHLDSSYGINDSSAYRVKLLNMNTFVLNDAKNKFLTAEAGYSMNMAIGSDATYNRVDIAAGYLQPFYWNTVANVKLGYFNLTYPSHSQGRVDNNMTLTAGATKKINDRYTGGLTANYNNNNSTVDINAYNKWTLMATMTAVVGL